MSAGEALLWIMASLLIAVFVYFFLVPWASNKFVLWKVKRVLARMAKKYEGTETGDQLKEAAELAGKAMKEEKL